MKKVNKASAKNDIEEIEQDLENAKLSSASLSEVDDDEPIYKERKCTLMSEFAVLVDYNIV